MQYGRGSILIACLLFMSIGCASRGQPITQTQLTETEATIRSAESAGAFQHAPTLLQKARQSLSAAQLALGKGDYAIARERLLETTTYAEAARGRAQVEQQKNDTAMMRRQADDLERQVEAARKHLQDR